MVGSGDATTVIENGQVLTVNCAEGDQGAVYEGALDWQVEETNIDKLARPKTNIMVNLGNPELAFKTSFIPNDGVGLARMEFIIAEYIKVHPMALLYPKCVSDAHEREVLQSLTLAYTSPGDYFVQRLSEGVGTIAAAFYPKPVVARMSDFKSNEYGALLGGSDFELDEDNPMIGFRGASRYTHPAYAEGFDLECNAMLRVREEIGLRNVILMVPFCRRIEEAKAVLEAMARNGLRRGEKGLQV